MPYSIRKIDRSVESALRRIAVDQVRQIEGTLADQALAPAERVHQARKAVKRLRGLIRLVRSGFRDFDEEDRNLKAAGRGLAGPREARVALQTFDALSGHAALGDAALPLRAGLLAHLAAAEAPDQLEQGLQDYTSAMKQLRRRAGSWSLDQDGFSALAKAVTTGVAAAQAAERRARSAPGAKAIHRWRTAVKRHGYQSQLLRQIWPEMMQSHIEAVDLLGEMLGDWHDIDRLLEVLPAGALTEAAAARQTALLAEAHPLSRRIFAGSPAAFRKRWRGWWQVWTSDD